MSNQTSVYFNFTCILIFKLAKWGWIVFFLKLTQTNHGNNTINYHYFSGICINTSIWRHLTQHQSSQTVHSSLTRKSNTEMKHIRGFPTRPMAVCTIFNTLLLIYMRLKSFNYQQHFHSSDPTNAAQRSEYAESPHHISAWFIFPCIDFYFPTCRQQLHLGSSGGAISNQVCGLDRMLQNAWVW